MLIVDGANYKKEVMESKLPVVLDFFADWCPPCKMYGPSFESVAGKMGEKAKFAKVNVDNAKDIALQFGIMSIPATVMLKKGKVIGSIPGALAESDLEAWVSGKL